MAAVLVIAGCTVSQQTMYDLQAGETLPEGDTSTEVFSPMMRGMQGRHHAVIPAVYTGKSNTIEADEKSVQRGEELYSNHCVACHGESGLGDGPAGINLNPPASPIAHTSQMLSDAYLFWRISEGGVEFQTAMPAWKDTLNEEQIWDLVNYTRYLGSSRAVLVESYQTEQQAAMLSDAVDQGIINQGQADTFQKVHDALEGYLVDHPELQGSTDEREQAALSALTRQGIINEGEVLTFFEVHELLISTGLMP